MHLWTKKLYLFCLYSVIVSVMFMQMYIYVGGLGVWVSGLYYYFEF